MILKIYSVFDSKLAGYTQPFFMQTAGLAIRAFESAVNQEGHDFGKWSADYTLFELGSFHQDSGAFELHPQPVNLGTAASFLRPPSQPMPLFGSGTGDEGRPNGSPPSEDNMARRLFEERGKLAARMGGHATASPDDAKGA